MIVWYLQTVHAEIFLSLLTFLAHSNATYYSRGFPPGLVQDVTALLIDLMHRVQVPS